MIRATLAIIAMSLPCHADSVARWGDSTIELQATDHPGAVAQVTFRNALVHVPDAFTVDLDLGGFAVQASFVMGRGKSPDHVTIVLPPGYVASPQDAMVAESDSVVFLIFSTDGAGS
jgi:hypothetical protein